MAMRRLGNLQLLDSLDFPALKLLELLESTFELSLVLICLLLLLALNLFVKFEEP